MLNKIKKIHYIICVFLLTLICGMNVFSKDIRLDLVYGIDNQTKAGRKLPVELVIQNKDNDTFDGYIKVYMYYQEDSCVEYLYPISIFPNATIYKNITLTIGSNFNNLYVQITDNYDNEVCEEQIQIDSHSLDTNVIIGVLSDAPWKMDYFNNVILDGSNIKTKTINIEKNKLQRNPSILDSVDILIVSDMNVKELPSSVENAIFSFVNKGNVVILGTGGKGINAIPNIFEKYLVSPVFVNSEILNLPNPKLGDKESQTIHIDMCYYDFKENSTIYELDGKEILRKKSIGTGILTNATIAFGDFREYAQRNDQFVKDILQKSLGNSRLFKFQVLANSKNLETTDELISLMNVVDVSVLPNMWIVIVVCFSYLFLLIIISLICYSSMERKKYFAFFVCFVSAIYTISIPIIFNSSRKSKTFANFVKIVDMTDVSNEEIMYATTRSPYLKNYKMRADLSSSVYALIDSINKRMLLSEDIKVGRLNKISIASTQNGTDINVYNNNTFVPAYLMVENKNVDSTQYGLKYNVSMFNNKLVGFIENNSKYDVTDMSLVLYEGIAKIGDVKAGEKKYLKDYIFEYMPIQNTYQISEAISNYPENKIIKTYLDSHINGYYDNAKIIGFIHENNFLPIESKEIEDVNGIVLFSKDIDIVRGNEEFDEQLSLKYDTKTINGDYNVLDNTITGDTPVENEYFFELYKNINQITFENIAGTSSSQLDYTIPFDGNIYLYNLQNESYELLNDTTIKEADLEKYLSASNSIRVRFDSRTEDIFRRKIYLPILRAVMEK